MIDEDKNFMFAAFQIVPPSFKNFNNSQKFIAVSFVSSLYKNHFSKKVGHWVPLTKIRFD